MSKILSISQKISWWSGIVFGFLALAYSVNFSRGEGEPDKAVKAPVEEKGAHTSVTDSNFKDAAEKTSEREEKPKFSERCLTDESVLYDLKKRRESLDEKEKQLSAKEEELKKLDQSLKEELGKLKAQREELTVIEGMQDAKAAERVGKLVEAFQTMSPKSAAGIVSKLDDQLAITTLSRVETPKLAKILAALEPSRSTELSEMLALGRKVSKSKRSNNNEPEKGGEKK